MYRITADATADLFFQLAWESNDAHHTDAYSGRRVSLWRDLLTPSVHAALMRKQAGDQIQLDFSPGELIPVDLSAQPLSLSGNQFDPQRVSLGPMIPRLGRFYPKGLLKDVSGILSNNREPFRCVGIDDGRLLADLFHPLARRRASLQITVGAVHSKLMDYGGTSRDWMAMVTDGVGMQARWQNLPTQFFADRPFDRQDDSPDAAFYRDPRLVQHLDDTALELVRSLHGRFLKNDMNVLDLMSSWQTHLPSGVTLGRVTGLGLNAEELRRNSALTEWLVKDLNGDPRLPFPTASFDAVICAVSVEYLVHPMEIFAEVARVLTPGGVFVVTFSNRWFPDKTIRIWTELHEFERMGLVLEYFRHSGRFADLHTYSIRGLPRPREDKHYGRYPFSDPVYAVWAVKQ